MQHSNSYRLPNSNIIPGNRPNRRSSNRRSNNRRSSNRRSSNGWKVAGFPRKTQRKARNARNANTRSRTTQKKTRNTSKAFYHQEGMCEANNEALMEKLQHFANKGDIDSGLAQIKNCIEGRRKGKERIGSMNTPHLHQLRALEQLFRDYKNLKEFGPDDLETVVISQKTRIPIKDDRSLYFDISVGGHSLTMY